MNLSNVVAHHADRRAGETAFGYRGEVVTYGELKSRAERMAGVLAAAGVGRGDVFAVLLHNSLAFVDLMCAGAQLGAVVLPLNWRLAGAELEYILDHAEAKVLVSEEELKPLVASMPRPPAATRLSVDGASGDGWSSIAEMWDRVEPVERPAEVAGDDLHRLMYTSGTTSRPKGAMITYDNLYWKCAGQVVELGLTAADRGLACGPLYHVGALDLVTTNVLYVGGMVEIVRKFDVVEVLAAIEAKALTVLWLAPAMVNLIVSDPRAAEFDLSSVRALIDGGEKMPLPLIERVLATFPNAWFADAYGLTETVSGDTFLDKGSTTAKLGSVGKPILHAEVRIVDAEDRPLGPEEVGEVCLRGPKVFKGYWRDPEATAKALRGGWFHTGDLGRLDEDGYLFIVDRLKDMIVTGGENVSSLEVERAVYEHPGVLEAAVVAAPHPTWNEVPAAYVVRAPGAELGEEELIAFCRERLAKYKVPKSICFVPELPRNPSGKVLKRVLRDRELGRVSG